MADCPKNQGVFFLRPGFLFLCMYIMLYTVLRNNGEIVYQYGRSHEGSPVHLVGPNPQTPRWRQQVYRVCFSPIMVGEEESRSLAVRGQYIMDHAEQYAEKYGEEYGKKLF